VLCLALAFSCLVAAGVGLGVGAPVPARSARAVAYLLPGVAAVFLLVVGALLRSRSVP
jgi:hypothetical protein